MNGKITFDAALSNGALIRRLLAVSWQYRWGCLKVLFLQTIILLFALFGLSFTGLGIDELRFAVQAAETPPHWPFRIPRPQNLTTMHLIAVIALAVLVVAILRGFLDYFYRVAVNQLVQGEIVVNLRAQVYDKMQRLSFRFFDANATGSIINRVTGDVQSVRMFVDQVVIQIFIMVLSLGFYLAYMLSLHVTLTLACLATTPALWFLSANFSRVVEPAYRKNRELFDNMIQRLSESIRGVQVVKAFALEKEEMNKLRATNKVLRDQQGWIFWRNSTFTPAIGFLSQMNVVVLLGYGGYLVIEGHFPLGTGLLTFAAILQQFSGQISNLATVTNSMQQSLTGARRVFEVLDAPLEIQSPAAPIHRPRLQGHVRFENVWFDHGGEPVLRDLSFEARAGQCIAIVGATGAGKSSLMGLIPRFYDPQRGRVTIDGVDLRELELDELRRNVGLVFQESFLFSTTIAANISFGHPQATRGQIENAARIAAAHEFIVSLPRGYDTILGEGGGGLSGGQRQRLAIARAVLLDPSILLLDDPTASVDPGTEHEIIEAMEAAMESRTTFIAAHRLSMLRRADSIIVMENGRIVQTGNHEELMKQPGYYLETALLQFAEAG